MNRKIKGVIKLTRFREYLAFVCVTTFLGAAAGGGSWGWPLILVLAANMLGVGFSFMFNDVEDAVDDALNPEKINRNPISAGILSAKDGRIISFVVAGLAVVIFSLLGWRAALIGWLSLVMGYVYSRKGIRLKSVPILDVISHGLLLAGLQFLAARYTFGTGIGGPWLWPLIFVVSICMYGQLFNEVRDFEGDKRAKITHTADLIGKKWAEKLMNGFLLSGVICGLYSVVWLRLIPGWVFLTIAGLTLAMAIKPMLAIRKGCSMVELHRPWQKPVEISAAITLGLWLLF